jgi:S-formylglutathione hydrolase FrmB
LLLAAVLAAAALSPMACAASATPAAPTAPNVWKQYTVESPSSGKIERFWVGCPATIKPGAPAADAPRYPVIYFLPGLMDNDDTWKNGLDPILAKYKIIAVCPTVGGASWFMNSPRLPWMKWGDFLTQDLRGFIEANYPASSEKGQRGICGISSGGHGAFYEATTQPQLYGSVSVLSGAMELRGYNGFGLDYWIGPRSPETTRLYVERSCTVLAGQHTGALPFELFLDSGDTDGALSQMEGLRKVLDSKGDTYKWFVGKGGHDWTYWAARADDHLAWHNEQFMRNRREGRYAEKPAAKAPELKVLTGPPDVTLSDEAARRLRASWGPPAGARSLAVEGLPIKGGPLSKTDAKYKELRLTATLTAAGNSSAVYVYRLTALASTPLEPGGTLSMSGVAMNERGRTLCFIPAVAMNVPAGQPDRKVELHARMVVELKAPDPIRGGIVAAIQWYDSDGKPVGEPAVGQGRPGTIGIEGWPLGPTAHAAWFFSLAGEKALGLATIHEFRVEVEP